MRRAAVIKARQELWRDERAAVPEDTGSDLCDRDIHHRAHPRLPPFLPFSNAPFLPPNFIRRPFVGSILRCKCWLLTTCPLDFWNDTRSRSFLFSPSHRAFRSPSFLEYTRVPFDLNRILSVQTSIRVRVR